MIRSEIIERFRTDNPEITSRVITDDQLYGYCEDGDKEFCAITRCIVGDTTFDSVVTTSVYNTKYDLTSKITNFYDIDDFPGGGVIYDDDQLDKTTVAELDAENSSWRTRNAGTPDKWYRRGKYLYFDRPVSAVKTIRVYAVLISDDWNADVAPYNQLTYLEPFHGGMVKYLQWKAKEKIGKEGEGAKARKEFLDYCQWVKIQLGGNKFGSIRYQPKSNIYQPER